MIRLLPVIAALAFAAPASAQKIPPISLELTVPATPAHVARADGMQIAYELRILSFHRSPLRLNALEILDDTGRTLGRYEGGTLAADPAFQDDIEANVVNRFQQVFPLDPEGFFIVPRSPFGVLSVLKLLVGVKLRKPPPFQPLIFCERRQAEFFRMLLKRGI